VEELLAERGVEVHHVSVYRFGQVIDVFVSPRRDARAARRFFQQAIKTTKVTPAEVTTDQAATYPIVLDEVVPAAWHHTEQYANNRIEADHGRLKARLRPMRGLKQDRSARIIIAGHALCRTSAEVSTNWRSRSWRTGGWWSRSRSWPWRSELGVASRELSSKPDARTDVKRPSSSLWFAVLPKMRETDSANAA
jgi:hypothetical protein